MYARNFDLKETQFKRSEESENEQSSHRHTTVYTNYCSFTRSHLTSNRREYINAFNNDKSRKTK